MVRNLLVSGILTGHRSIASGQPLFDSLGQIVEVFQGWADPLYAIHWQLQHSPWLIAGLLLLLAAILLITPRPGRASSVFWVFALLYPCDHRRGGAVHGHAGHRQPIPRPGLRPAAVRRGVLAGRTPVQQGVGEDVHRPMGAVALALIGGACHVGVSVQQNLQLTAEALESGYIGKSFNTAYWEDSELVEHVRANPVSGRYRYYSNDPNVLRWNAGVPGTLVTWVAVPRRGPAGHLRLPALVRAGRLEIPAVRGA